MKTLILDSATNLLYTVLLIDDQIVFESYVKGKNDHASAILVEVEKACKKGNIELKELDKVIVGYGPGSYTGVRMAVTVGKMITTMEPKIKLYTISTLFLMASGSSGKVLAEIDARRGNCFGCILDMSNGCYLIKEGLIEKEKLRESSFDACVNENEFLVNPFVVDQQAVLVEEPRTLVPNYLRETEAERNIHA